MTDDEKGAAFEKWLMDKVTNSPAFDELFGDVVAYGQYCARVTVAEDGKIQIERIDPQGVLHPLVKNARC